MAMMPCFEDLYHELDYLNSRIYEEFGLCPRDLLGYHHGCWRQPWCHRLETKLSVGKDGFQVKVDVDGFKKDEMTVKTVDDIVVIEGKHKEKKSGWKCISRQFIRKYKLPRGYDPEKVVSSLSSDGVLTVTVPPPDNVPDVKERLVTISDTEPER